MTERTVFKPPVSDDALVVRHLNARLRTLGILFGVPDGGLYINDWIERAVALGVVTEERAREIVKEEALRG